MDIALLGSNAMLVAHQLALCNYYTTVMKPLQENISDKHRTQKHIALF